MTRPFRLDSLYRPAGDQPEAIASLIEGLSDGLAQQALLGVTGSGKTFTIANVIEAVQRPTLVLAPNKTLAAQLYGEMKGFSPKNAVEYFVSYYDYYQPEAYMPASDTYIEKDASINEHIEQMRLSATKALLERPDTIIVATVSAIYGLGDPVEYHSMVLHLVRGAEVEERAILRRLAELQYTRNDIELRRATYRARGEVIDIFPAESESEAVRVELFDDRIDSLSFFDPLTGETLRKVARLTVYPKSHYVTKRQTILDAIEAIKVDLAERLEELRASGKLLEAQRLEQRTRFDLEMMHEIGYCAGIENYSRYLSGRNPGEPPPTLVRLSPRRCAPGGGREPRDHPPARGDVSRRPRAQGKPGGLWISPALGARQPALALRGVGEARTADDLRFGNPGALRASTRGPGGRAGGPPDRARGP